MARRERTPEEREADRREREARRAAKEGRAPVDFNAVVPPPPVEPEPEPEPVAPEPEPVAPEPQPLEPEPVEAQPPVEPEPPAEPEPVYEELPAEPVHEEPAQEAPVPEEPAGPPQPPPPPPSTEVVPARPPVPPPAYRPPPAIPSARRADRGATQEFDPFASGVDAAGTRRRSSRTIAGGTARQRRQDSATAFMERHNLFGDDRGRGGSRRRWVIPAVIALVAIVGLWFILSLFQPFKGDGGDPVTVTIPRGASVGEIADILHDRGVVSSPFFFRAKATLSGDRNDLKPGTFQLRKDASYGSTLAVLTAGPPPNIVKITIPEGRSRSETADIVGDQLHGNYIALTRKSPNLDPKDYGGKKAKNLEGFLFPATYTLKKGSPTVRLVNQQLATFKRQFATVNTRYAKSKNLTDYDILTIASMIDREAQLAKERPVIASVIYNRLKAGIPLGIDATIRFATNNWTRPLTQSQLATQSPYNTRLRKGLPPGPIGSPGLASIKAAARPAKTNYLFYVVKPGGCGEHAFSATDAEFQQDVERYNSARQKAGGKSPTNC